MDIKKLSLDILRYASKLPATKPITPVPDVSALIGFSYPELKDILQDSSQFDSLILKRLEDAGYLIGAFSDRVLLCPNCLAYNIIFRDTCPECGSPNIVFSQMVAPF